MRKVYAIARVSTEEQKKKYGIPTQVEYFNIIYNSKLRSEGYELIVKEEAASGKDIIGRPLMQEILDVIGEGDILLVYDISRLAREVEDSSLIIKRLRERKAELWVGDRKYAENSPDDRLAFHILAAIAEYQLNVQKIKSKAGIAVKKEKQEWIFTSRLYGYNITRNVNKPIEINQSEAEILKKIFNEYKNGNSILKITNMLNQNGIHTKSGSIWHAASLRRLILKPIYMGYYKPYSGKQVGQEKTVVIKDDLIKSKFYEPIIDEDTWWSVYNSFRSLTRKHSRQYQYRYSAYELTSIIKCGYCLDLGKTHSYVHSIHKYKNVDTTSYVLRLHEAGCQQHVCTLRASITEKLFSFVFLLFCANLDELEHYLKIEDKENEIIKEKLNTENQNIYNQIHDIGEKIDFYKTAIIKNRDKPLLVQSYETSLNDELIKELSLKATIKLNESKIADVNIAMKNNYLKQLLKSQADLIKEFRSHKRNAYKKLITLAYIKDYKLEINFLGGKKFIIPLSTKRTRNIQQKFNIQSWYYDELQYAVEYDAGTDSWGNLVNLDDTMNEEYFIYTVKTVLNLYNT